MTIVIIICLTALLVIPFILYVLWLKPVSMITKAINKHGPAITNTEISLGNAYLSLFSGRVELRNFTLSNPEGFKSRQAIKAESILLYTERNAFMGNPLIINKIEVVAPEITYEKAEGTDNFRTILNNIKSAVSPKDRSSRGLWNGKKRKKVLIKEFVLKDGRMGIVIPLMAGTTISVPLPDINIENLEMNKEAVTPEQAFKVVFMALYEKIGSAVFATVRDKGLRYFGRDMDIMRERAGKMVQVLTDKLSRLFHPTPPGKSDQHL
jgi:hypothetical protein